MKRFTAMENNKLASWKHLILIIFILIGVVGVSRAQDDRGWRQKMENLKIAFFTEQLSLTSEEAQVFWPVYNAYQEELNAQKRANNQKQRKLRQAFMGDDNVEIENLLDEFIELQGQEHEINKKYHKRLKEVLPIRKVAQLYKAEDEFRQRIMQELRKRRNQQRGMRNEDNE